MHIAIATFTLVLLSGCASTYSDDDGRLNATYYGQFITLTSGSYVPPEIYSVDVFKYVPYSIITKEKPIKKYSHSLSFYTKESYRLTFGSTSAQLHLVTEREEQAVFKEYSAVTYRFEGGTYSFPDGEIQIMENAILINGTRYLQLENYSLALAVPTGSEEERTIHPDPEIYDTGLELTTDAGVITLENEDRIYNATLTDKTCRLVQTEPEYREIGVLSIE